MYETFQEAPATLPPTPNFPGITNLPNNTIIPTKPNQTKPNQTMTEEETKQVTDYIAKVRAEERDKFEEAVRLLSIKMSSEASLKIAAITATHKKEKEAKHACNLKAGRALVEIEKLIKAATVEHTDPTYGSLNLPVTILQFQQITAYYFPDYDIPF